MEEGIILNTLLANHSCHLTLLCLWSGENYFVSLIILSMPPIILLLCIEVEITQSRLFEKFQANRHRCCDIWINGKI